MTGDVEGRITAALDTLLAANAPADTGPVGVAVSGGGDSLALLLAARLWGRQHRRPILAATVDHGLRAESAAEAVQVADVCRSIAVAHDTLRLDALRDGPNLQARARAARYDALSRWARSRGCRVVLLGHTCDDVAETLVLRLRRGAGVDGLARMREWLGGDPAFARPLLEMRRADLRAYLRGRDIVPAEDPGNDDPRFDRVAARQAIAALGLETEGLARSAVLLREARQSLERRALDLAARIARTDRGDLLLDRAAFVALASAEREQARRLLVGALRWIGGNPLPPRGAELTSLLDGLAAGEDRTLGGCLLRHEDLSLRIGREPAATAPPCPAGETWDGRWRIRGPKAPEHRIGALGDDIAQTRWRDAGMPRASLVASPAIRDKMGKLVAAPLVNPSGGWTAETCVAFAQALIDR